MLIVHKQATNVKQIQVKTDINPVQIALGSNPCQKPCATCPYMQKTTSITSWKTKQKFTIKGGFSCQTKNVIYVINCLKCGLQYIGQSGNTFNERFRGHIADIRQENNVKPVSRHFCSGNHTLRDFNACIVAQTTSNINYRLRTEEAWIHTLQTKTPTGLNLIQ